MLSRLITIAVTLFLVLGFIGINLSEKMTISFGLFRLTDIPVLYGLTVAFCLGIFATLFVRTLYYRKSSSPKRK